MKGWRRSIVINIIGAITTCVRADRRGRSRSSRTAAWLSILIMALLVPLFYVDPSPLHLGPCRGAPRHRAGRRVRARTTSCCWCGRSTRRPPRRSGTSVRSVRGRCRCVHADVRRCRTTRGAMGGVRGSARRRSRRCRAREPRAVFAVRVARSRSAPHDIVNLVVPELVGQGSPHTSLRKPTWSGSRRAAPRAARGGDRRAGRDGPTTARAGSMRKPLDPAADGRAGVPVRRERLTIRAVNYAQSLDATLDARDLLRPRPGGGAPAGGGVVRRRARGPVGHRRGAVPRPHGTDAGGGPALLGATGHGRQRDRARGDRQPLAAAAAAQPERAVHQAALPVRGPGGPVERADARAGTPTSETETV